LPSFQHNTMAAAPPKVLYDPSRFPEWWAGVEAVEVEKQSADADGPTSYSKYSARYPGVPLPHQLHASRDQQSVVVSCLVSDVRFDWRLEPLNDGQATRISVHVEIPQAEAHRFGAESEVIATSLSRLAALVTGS
jgi:hypothetical protein